MNVSRFSPRACALGTAITAAFACAPSVVLSQGVSLPPTTVTATRFAEAAQSLPMGVSVVTAEEIRASGASTINEALMRVLGVAGRQDFYGGGEYGLDLRGFGAGADNNQVVVVDGLRVSEADLGGTRLSGIAIESVERIEVIRGSGAVLYGEGATGGVIVITTKAGTGKERRNAASVYAGAGSFGLRDLRANGTVAGGGFSFDASAQKRRSDNHRDNFQFDSDAVSLTGQWSNDWLRAGVRVAQDSLDTRLPGALTMAQYIANPRQSTKPTDQASIRDDSTGAFAQAQVGDWLIAADIGERGKELRSMNSGFAYDYDIAARTQSLRARHEAKLGGATNLLIIGADRSSWARDVLGAFGSTATQTSRALYLKDDVTLAGGTRIGAGFRTERVVKGNSTALAGTANRMHAWELGVSHPFTPAMTAYARLGRSFRLANVDEFGFTSPGVVLQPQTSRDAELGAKWSQGATQMDARLYHSRIDNEIGFDPLVAGPFGLPGANANFDPIRRQGVEIDARHAVSSTVGLRVNAALRSATFESGTYAGGDVPLVARRTLALRADWEPAPQHRVTGGVNWVSSQHPDFNNACTMPAYTVADVRYAYQWRQLEVSLGIANLAGKKYFTQAFGCVGTTTSSIYPEPGRAFTAAVRASF